MTVAVDRERTVLMRDAAYFSSELARRLERLEEIETTGRLRTQWQQASKLTRLIRGLMRKQIDREREIRRELARRRAR